MDNVYITVPVTVYTVMTMAYAFSQAKDTPSKKMVRQSNVWGLVVGHATQRISKYVRVALMVSNSKAIIV